MNILKPLDQKRVEYLDILRGLGIIFIVIGHISYNDALLNWLYSFHVPLFFFAAGAVYKKRSVIRDLKRRAMTVLVPYFSFGALEVIYWQLFERRFRPSDMGFGKSVLGLLIGQYDYLDFNSHLWFLPCFFVTAVLFNTLVNVGGKGLAYAVAAAMSAVYIFVPLPELPFGANRVFRYMVFYAVGVLASDVDLAEKYTRQNTALKMTEAYLLLAASTALSYFGLTSGAMYFITASIGTCGVFFVSLGIGKCRPLQYLGRISLVILCIHGAVYRILLKLLSLLVNTDTDAVREHLYWVMPVAALTLVICAGAYEIIVRTVPIMIGKKRTKNSREGANRI